MNAEDAIAIAQAALSWAADHYVTIVAHAALLTGVVAWSAANALLRAVEARAR